MGLSSISFMIVSSYFLLLFPLVLPTSLQSYTPTCHDDEKSALLQFKHSFVIRNNASMDGAYPKTSSWNSNSSCCSWDGVECDEKRGHVTGLHLSSSCLYGSFSSNNSLFSLVHLERLNLAGNNFNSSQIPHTIRNFPKLRYLNLSYSIFSGHVPSEISQLSKLSSLDLSHNFGMFSSEELLRSLAQNLTGLETLDLSSINISSTVPNTLANLSHLTSLGLGGCSLSGKFIERIFKLKNLKILDVSVNPALTGYFPDDYNGSSPHLVSLKLSYTSFVINLPALIERFHSLKELDVGSCNISEGPLPFSLGNLKDLIYLDLSYNMFNGQIPATLGNLTQCTYLSLYSNNFHGSIPHSLFNLMNLQTLYLDHNNLSGTVEFHKFLKLQKLTYLDLSSNNLEVLTESRSFNNATTVFPKFEFLRLRSCNLTEFPNFLRYQDSLTYLDISGNKMQGPVPKWNCNLSRLRLLDLSNNKLSGMLPQCLGNSSKDLETLQLQNNNLSGNVSPLICNPSRLRLLDLSSNKLSGMLPQCVGNFSKTLEYLNLGNNSFHGILSQTFTTASCRLTMFDVSHNQFQGKLPRSLANCATLEFLVLSNNEFDDVFPFWLGTLQKLKILAMRHNGFYGVIGHPEKKLHFSELRILDLSYNSFRGQFPTEYIFSGYAIRGISLSHQRNSADSYDYYLQCSITITNKGIEIYYPQIQEDLVAIHISSNKFEGSIPEFIGKLKGLRLLNISNNSFTGRIPSSFGNLTLLESLDLSQNRLSGEIPQQLSRLSFLEKFNVSHNSLTGHIPGGNQFSTFDILSYEGNPGLCGDPLPKKCGNIEGVKLPPRTENPEGSRIELDWKFALAGLGSGLVVGVVLADVAIARWEQGFIKTVGMFIRLVKRMRRCRK